MFEQAMSHYLALNLKKTLGQPIDSKELGFVFFVGQSCNQPLGLVNLTDDTKDRIVKMYQALNLAI